MNACKRILHVAERAGIFAGLLITCWLWIPALGLAWFVCRYVKRWEVE